MLAQAFDMCTAPSVVFVGGLIGKQLASDDNLAILPIRLWSSARRWRFILRLCWRVRKGERGFF
jgi:hypothetical protein